MRKVEKKWKKLCKFSHANKRYLEGYMLCLKNKIERYLYLNWEKEPFHDGISRDKNELRIQLVFAKVKIKITKCKNIVFRIRLLEIN